MKQFTINIPDDVAKKIEDMCEKHQCSIAWITRYILKDWVEKEREIIIKTKEK